MKIISPSLFNDSSKAHEEVVTEVLASRIRVALVRLKPRESVGDHSTGKREEVIVPFTGDGVLQSGGSERAIRRGEFVYIPPMTQHNIKNVGSEDLVYAYFIVSV